MLLPGKGSEFLKFHSFFNCQAIRLSADRTSIGPTPPDIRVAIEEQVLELARDIFEDEGVAALLESLDEAEFGERTAEQEKKDYARRVKQAKAASVATYKTVELREPQRKLGVVAMLAQLLSVEPQLFPFRVLDWNNAAGFDPGSRPHRPLVRRRRQVLRRVQTAIDGFLQPFAEQRAVHRVLGYRPGKRGGGDGDRRHPADGHKGEEERQLHAIFPLQGRCAE